MPAIYPYTVTNSQKGGFFSRTYHRNVRRAWDGEDYHAPKRQKFEGSQYALYPSMNENNAQLDPEDNLQRAIRETSVAAMSSSPSRKNSTVFSFSEAYEQHNPSTLTPPSSPPPLLDITPPVIKARKPTFSILEKKKQKEKEKLKAAKRKREEADAGGLDASEPLSEIMNSSSRASAQSAPTLSDQFLPVQALSHSDTLQPKNMTQTILDFGQSITPITCGQCHMSYTPSIAEDAKIHNMYHNRHKDGIELDKKFMSSAAKWAYQTPDIPGVPKLPGSVVVADRKISMPARRTVQNVLEVVSKELGSVEIPEADLWGQKKLDGEAEDAKKVDCYKVFLHVIENKCVGVCVAERISQGYRVKSVNIPVQLAEDSNPRKESTASKEDPALLTPTSSSATPNHFPSSADIVLEENPSPCVVGVSRLWTSKAFRQKGIGNNLIELLTTQFIYGLDIEKEQVAFSQPTDMGASLAKSWYGAETGWNVYREN